MFLFYCLSPLSWSTLAYLLGISISSSMNQTLCVAGAVAVSIGVLFFTRKLSVLIITISFCTAGFYRNSRYVSQWKEHHVILSSTPLSGKALVQDCTSRRGHFKTCLTLTIIELDTCTTICPVTVQLQVPQTLSCEPDDTISFKNLTFNKLTNASYAHYLCKQGIGATGYLKKLEHQPVHRPSWSIRRYLTKLRKSLINKIKSSVSEQCATLFLAVFLGVQDHTSSLQELRSGATAWGTVHLLARSGLHVVALIGLWRLPLQAIGLTNVLQKFIIGALLCLYYLLSWPSISFIRALATYVLHQTINILGYSVHLIHLLSLVLLTILIVNPTQLFFLDFQLSFLLTFSLALYRETAYQKRIITHSDGR